MRTTFKILIWCALTTLIMKNTNAKLKKKRSQLKELKNDKDLIKAQAKIRKLFVLFYDPNSNRSQEAIEIIQKAKRKRSISKSKVVNSLRD